MFRYYIYGIGYENKPPPKKHRTANRPSESRSGPSGSAASRQPLRQYNVCGKPGCRCKDPKNPRRHGPYYKVSYVYRGRYSSRFVPRDQAKAVRAELANYKRLRDLTEKWVGLSLRLAKENANRPLDIPRERFTLQYEANAKHLAQCINSLLFLL